MVVIDEASLVPRVDGSVQVGWTSEEAEFDIRPPLEAIAREIAGAQYWCLAWAASPSPTPGRGCAP
jgi:hypothetical protein